MCVGVCVWVCVCVCTCGCELHVYFPGWTSCPQGTAYHATGPSSLQLRVAHSAGVKEGMAWAGGQRRCTFLCSPSCEAPTSQGGLWSTAGSARLPVNLVALQGRGEGRWAPGSEAQFPLAPGRGQHRQHHPCWLRWEPRLEAGARPRPGSVLASLPAAILQATRPVMQVHYHFLLAASSSICPTVYS